MIINGTTSLQYCDVLTSVWRRCLILDDLFSGKNCSEKPGDKEVRDNCKLGDCPK